MILSLLDQAARWWLEIRERGRAGRQPVPRWMRHVVLRRDGPYCRYCGCYTHGNYHLDHVWPVSRGGPNSVWNLVVACIPCNLRKSGKVGVWPPPVGYWDNGSLWRKLVRLRFMIFGR
ncbi:MAG: HNH endonuclease [Chloroflexi bacterium]|nr:HNH endonuclease [Chloroflexota bacterium]